MLRRRILSSVYPSTQTEEDRYMSVSHEGRLMSKYEWKNDTSKLLRKLRNSRTLKEKYGWSRDIGTGFIKDDINSVTLNPDGTFTIAFGFNHTQTFTTTDLNLRETEELVRYLEGN